MVIFCTRDELVETVRYWLDPKNQHKYDEFITKSLAKFKMGRFQYPANM